MAQKEDHAKEAKEQVSDPAQERFPELAELEEKIQRRLRQNQSFLDSFMDEDYDDLDDDEADAIDDDEPEQDVEL